MATLEQALQMEIWEKRKEVYENSFFSDMEKMRDFLALEKEDFLTSYSYLTEKEYDATALCVEMTRQVELKPRITYNFIPHGNGNCYIMVEGLSEPLLLPFYDIDFNTMEEANRYKIERNDYEWEAMDLWIKYQTLAIMQSPYVVEVYEKGMDGYYIMGGCLERKEAVTLAEEIKKMELGRQLFNNLPKLEAYFVRENTGYKKEESAGKKTGTTRMEALKQYKQQKEDEKNQSVQREKDRIAQFVEQIQELMPRITELLDVYKTCKEDTEVKLPNYCNYEEQIYLSGGNLLPCIRTHLDMPYGFAGNISVSGNGITFSPDGEDKSIQDTSLPSETDEMIESHQRIVADGLKYFLDHFDNLEKKFYDAVDREIGYEPPEDEMER